ncbi:MAG: hypothetical protein V1822_03670 [Candidatus Micrarchaeota archaeon]
MANIVVPGDEIAQTPQRLAYTYTDGRKTYATVISLFTDEGKVIPLQGPYEPIEEDPVIGFVADSRHSGYDVDINSANKCFLSSRETRSTFRLSDMIMARIKSVDETGTIDLTDARLLKDGQLARISPVKIPRLIGKKNSMIGLISHATGCNMYVGRNGIVFISNEGDVSLAREAIDMIEKQAHTSGLTDRMAQFLAEKSGKEVSEISESNYESMPRSDSPPPSRGGFSRGGPRRSSGGFARRNDRRR